MKYGLKEKNLLLLATHGLSKPRRQSSSFASCSFTPLFNYTHCTGLLSLLLYLDCREKAGKYVRLQSGKIRIRSLKGCKDNGPSAGWFFIEYGSYNNVCVRANR